MGLNARFSGRWIGDLAVRPSTGQKLVGWGCAVGAAVFLADLTKPDGKFAIFRQAMCAARSCILIQQARLTMHGGTFLPAGFADAGDLALAASCPPKAIPTT